MLIPTIPADAYRALLFAMSVDGWFSFATDARTRKAFAWLSVRGIVECNRFGQARYVR